MSVEWILVEIFVIVTEVCLIFFLLCSKFKPKRKALIPTLVFMIGSIILIGLPNFFSLGNLLIAEIIVPIMCLIYLLLFRNGSVLKKIFWILITFAIIASIAILSTAMISVISGIDSSELMTESSVERFLAIGIAKIINIVSFYLLAKKKGTRENHLSPIPMIICFIVPLICIITISIIFRISYEGHEVPENIIFLISVSYLAINIIIFALYEIINRETEKNYVLMAEQKQNKMIKQHNDQVINIYSKMREWHHDYSNHMQLVAGMLKKIPADENVDAIIDYIKNLDGKIKSPSVEIYSGNHIVDAIVSSKLALASSHNIAFDYNVYLAHDIIMEDMDLCSVISNLLDNAIEACCKLEHKSFILFEMITVKNQLNMKIVNSASGNYQIENGKLITTKKGDLHGIGIGHVKSIIEIYNGFFDIKAEAKTFIVQISIPLCLQKSK